MMMNLEINWTIKSFVFEDIQIVNVVENDDIADKLDEMDDENEIRFKLKIVSGDSDDGNSDKQVEDNASISNPAPVGDPAHSKSHCTWHTRL